MPVEISIPDCLQNGKQKCRNLLPDVLRGKGFLHDFRDHTDPVSFRTIWYYFAVSR